MMESFETTVQEIIVILTKYSWVHQHRVTDFLKKKLYNNIPHDVGII